MDVIRLPKVMEKTGLARSTIWLWVKEKKFPPPTKLSARVAVWKLSEINLWLEEKMDGN